MAAGKSEDLGKLLLRLSVGIVLIFHGYAKIAPGVEWIKGPLAQVGLPGFIAYGVYLGELVGPLMVILGFRARIGALLMVINMAMAVFLAHRNQIFSIKEAGGGWAIELDALILLGALAVFFLGGGKFAVQGGKTSWD
ncbi:MAG TPA: DoxX family protein [Bacteroidota bacterium]|nr:DoxX family protein [Bacteroidota bacterium]